VLLVVVLDAGLVVTVLAGLGFAVLPAGCFSEAFVGGRDGACVVAGLALLLVVARCAAVAGILVLTVRVCAAFMFVVPAAGTVALFPVRVVTALVPGFTDVVAAGVPVGLVVFVVATQGVVAAVFWVADFFLNSEPKLEIAEEALEIALFAF